MTPYAEEMTDSADDVRQLVAERLRAKGLDMTNVSLGLGKNRTYLQQYITKKSPRWLPESIREQLAAYLDVRPEQLRDPSLRSGQGSINQFTKVPGTQSATRSSVEPNGLIEVLGMVECGPDGWSLWNGDVVDRVLRPPNLAGVPNAYAVYVVGTSMEDRYHPGELAYIHPGKPVTPGCYVVVQLRPPVGETTPRAVLKRLVKRSGDKITLAQLSPAKTFNIKAADLISMHRVVGSGEA